MSDSNRTSKISYVIFLIFVVISVYFFIFAGSKREVDFSFDDHSIFDWSDDWSISFGNTGGAKRDLPILIEAERGKTVVIRKTLPRKIKKYNCLMIESKRQEVLVHVGGILRTTYTDKDGNSVSKTPASSYILVPVYSSDAGQDISIFISSDSNHSGDISRVYLGNEVSLLLMLIKKNVIWVAIGAIMFIISVACLVGYIAYGKAFNEGGTLIHLFWFGLLAAIWCLTQSNIRQIFVRDIALFENLGYCCYMLIPMPLIFFTNWIFNNRYKVLFLIYSFLVFANFLVENFLQVLTSLDFYDMQIISHIELLIVVFTAIIMCLVYRKKEKNSGYVLYMFSGLVFLLAGISAKIIEVILCIDDIGDYFFLTSLIYMVTNVVHASFRFSYEQQQKKNAESANRAKSKFLATMSHEIRTPINAVLGMNEMIIRDSKESAIKEYAGNIAEAGRSLLSLVNDILDFSKIESGKMDIICVAYQMKSLLRDLILMIESRISKKGLSLILEIDEAMPSVFFGDEVRLKQVITNLLTNAVKYTETGSITFTVSSTNSEEGMAKLYVSVKDTGIGIKKEDMGKLMESFVRVDETRNRNIEGTGLGLAITTQILELMGSKLEIDSEYGEGSEFFFTLEQKVVDETPIGSVMNHDETEIVTENVTFCSPEARILAVDDNPMNLIVVKGLLRPSRVQIDTCESGRECLEMCSKKYYDIILMDHMMPEMDGIETLNQLRNDHNSPCCDTKVIALTANAISGAADMYMENGFNGYITKPIEIAELDSCLKSMLPKEIVLPFEAESPDFDQEETKHNAEALTTELIDGEVAMGYCGDDIKSYIEIVKSYYKYGVKKLVPDSENNNRIFGDIPLEEFTVMIHSLKSSSKTIGAVSLSEMAAKLEQAGLDKDEAYIEANEGQCKQVYSKVLEQLRLYLEERGVISPEVTGSSVDNTDNAQDNNAGISAKVRNTLEQVRDALDDFDYDVALELVEDILKSN